MKFGSLFSGIEAASAAWLPLGWRCAWVAEIDPFACAALRHHYPDVPNLGDVNRIDPDAVEPVGLVVFGSPCQSFSVAGKRLGLDDPRGNMALVGLRLIGRIRPRWVVWENVPGVLSSDQGRDFGAFLGLLGELGYGFAYRVLDAQHFGVPQRRRRVFVVGYLGDWRPPAAVLFEPESLRGDSAPRRQAGEDTPAGAGDGSAYSLKTPSGGGTWRGVGADNFVAGSVSSKWAKGAGDPAGDECYNLIAFDPRQIHHPANHSNPKAGDPCHSLRGVANAEPAIIAFSAKDHGADAGDTAPTLRAGGHTTSHANAGVMPAICHSLRADGFDASEDGTGRGTPLVCGTIGAESVRHTNGLKSEADLLVPVAYGIRSDAARAGEAKTPSPDAEGRVSLRDPGFNVYTETAPTLDSSAPHAVAFHENQRAETYLSDTTGSLNSGGGKPGQGYPAIMFDPTARQPEWSLDRPMKTDGPPAVAFTASEQANGYAWERDVYPTINAQAPNDSSNLQQGIRQGMSVRRLTPGECLKLQGFPPDYLDIQYRGKPAADGPKYRATGNSMAVPVIAWLGRRIQLVTDTIMELSDAAE